MEIIQLIKKTTEGDGIAMDKLFEFVYLDLKKLSRKIRLNWRNEQTLNTTALVHEAYLKVSQSTDLNSMNKLHFYRICGRAIKYILLDHLKHKSASKRGNGFQRVNIEDQEVVNLSEGTLEMMEDVFSCIEKLQSKDPIVQQVIECLFFADMTVKETSDLLAISPATVKRKWAFAKAYISNEVKKSA
ncbi:MAG: ECF-type sigma factor [Bacteroidota bacterium]